MTTALATLVGPDGKTYEIRQGAAAPDHFEVWRDNDDIASFVVHADGKTWKCWFTGKIDEATINHIAQVFVEKHFGMWRRRRP